MENNVILRLQGLVPDAGVLRAKGQARPQMKDCTYSKPVLPHRSAGNRCYVDGAGKGTLGIAAGEGEAPGSVSIAPYAHSWYSPWNIFLVSVLRLQLARILMHDY